MKTRELREELKKASIDELKEKRVSVAEELMRRRFRAASGQAPAGESLAQLRKQLARVETEIRARTTEGRLV